MSDQAERRIREAIARGEFDDLPGTGSPLSDLGKPYEPNWWVKRWVERERQTGRDAEDLLEIERTGRRLWAAESREELEHVMNAIDGERGGAGLEPLDRNATIELWRSVRRRIR